MSETLDESAQEYKQEQLENVDMRGIQSIPLFVTIAINPTTGQYGTKTNAATVQQVQTIANVLLQEYQRLIGQVLVAVSQNGQKQEV